MDMDASRPQRRTKAGRLVSTITREELESCFHMPSEQACRHLGVGLTILKRVCRRFGIPRWPYSRQGKHDDMTVEGGGGYGSGGGGGGYGSGGSYGGGAAGGGGAVGGIGYGAPNAPAMHGVGPPPMGYGAPQLGPPAHVYAPLLAPPQQQQQPQPQMEWQQQLQAALAALLPQQQQQQQQQLPPQPQPVANLGQLLLSVAGGAAPPQWSHLSDATQLAQAAVQQLVQQQQPQPYAQPHVSPVQAEALYQLVNLLQQQQPLPAPPPQQLPQPQSHHHDHHQQHPRHNHHQLSSHNHGSTALLPSSSASIPPQAPAQPQPSPVAQLQQGAAPVAGGSAGGSGAQRGAELAPPGDACVLDEESSLEMLAAAVDCSTHVDQTSAGAAVNVDQASAAAAVNAPAPVEVNDGSSSQADDEADARDAVPQALPEQSSIEAPASVQAAPTEVPPQAGGVPKQEQPEQREAAAAARATPAAAGTAAAAEDLSAAAAAAAVPTNELERQLLAALPDLHETFALLRRAADQLQAHLLAQRLLRGEAAAVAVQLPGACQLTGVNAELAELCVTTLLNMLDGNSFSNQGALVRIGNGGAAAAALDTAGNAAATHAPQQQAGMAEPAPPVHSAGAGPVG